LLETTSGKAEDVGGVEDVEDVEDVEAPEVDVDDDPPSQPKKPQTITPRISARPRRIFRMKMRALVNFSLWEGADGEIASLCYPLVPSIFRQALSSPELPCFA
jgi:hypothetical protein